jgi:hypothetical protein
MQDYGGAVPVYGGLIKLIGGLVIGVGGIGTAIAASISKSRTSKEADALAQAVVAPGTLDTHTAKLGVTDRVNRRIKNVKLNA